MIKRLIILLLLTCSAFGYSPSITSFTGGQAGWAVEARSDYQKYPTLSRTIENMFVLAQGPVVKRPGTKSEGLERWAKQNTV